MSKHLFASYYSKSWCTCDCLLRNNGSFLFKDPTNLRAENEAHIAGKVDCNLICFLREYDYSWVFRLPRWTERQHKGTNERFLIIAYIVPSVFVISTLLRGIHDFLELVLMSKRKEGLSYPISLSVRQINSQLFILNINLPRTHKWSSHFFPFNLPWSDETRYHDLNVLNVEFSGSFSILSHPYSLWSWARFYVNYLLLII